jgi:hypothetical protein
MRATRRLPWVIGGILCLVAVSILAGLATSAGSEVGIQASAARPADQVAVLGGADDVSPADPMGKGASCHRKLRAQLPIALADHGLEVGDPGVVEESIRHAIGSVCRQGPASTTVKRGAISVLACMAVLTDDVELEGIEVMGASS